METLAATATALKLMNERIEAIRTTFRNDVEAGERDAKNGIYDKWYRWHRADDGAAYESGWLACKNEELDYRILEG